MNIVDLKKEINAFVKKNIDLEIPKTERKNKVINDKVWGNINFYNWEMDLINQPILQRLRYISQTGSAYYVYPTSNHSRFEHSLGVLAALMKIVESINSRYYFPTNNFEIKTSHYYILRLACILHDVGHAFFSHVSEKFQCNNNSFERYWKNIRKELEIAYKKETKTYLNSLGIKSISKKLTNELCLDKEAKHFSSKIKIHEILSYFIVRSKAFKEFFIERILFDEIRKDFEVGKKLEEKQINELIIKMISDCIIGLPPIYSVDECRLEIYKYMAQLINGPIDVDKLDYLARDSYTAGIISISYDIERFLTKITVLKTQLNHHDTYRIAVDIGGAHVFDQIMICKMMLYTYIYHHHKVLTGDRMLIEICKLLNLEAIENKDFSFFKSPADLLNLSESCFNSNCEAFLKDIENFKKRCEKEETLPVKDREYILTNYQTAKEILTAYSKRKLFSRSLVVYPKYISFDIKVKSIKDYFENSDVKSRINQISYSVMEWYDDNRDILKQEDEKYFFEKYISKIDKIYERFKTISSFFYIITPKPPTANEAREMTYIKWPKIDKIDYIFPIDHWIRAYIHYRWAIYVVAIDELREFINVITRYHLFDDMTWKIDKLSAINSHLDTVRLNEITEHFVNLSKKYEKKGFPLKRRILNEIIKY